MQEMEKLWCRENKWDREISESKREKTTLDPTVLAMPLRQESINSVHQLH